VTNSEGLDSQLLRRAMAQRNGAIIPLIQWPLSDAGYHYAWLFQFLNERTRTENLVARGGNTQLFSLEENPIHSRDETV
jgi:RHH-type proline utilization regulon transcriptional repressor/proline dehydrogenase/delta 1-pyrroline-5-carboxylate dehydrogenase